MASTEYYYSRGPRDKNNTIWNLYSTNITS